MAFKSRHVLGFQLRNENGRFGTMRKAWGFPQQHLSHYSLLPWYYDVMFSWGEYRPDGLYSKLHHGAATWDRMLLWGIDPAQCAGLPWLRSNELRKVFMAGGSDAHGDLNHRRQGAIDGWSGTNDTALGTPRNLLFVGSARPKLVNGIWARSAYTISQTQVVDGFKSGRFSVTDGPALRIAIDRNDTCRSGRCRIDDGDTPMGSTLDVARGRPIPLLVQWKSTPEFGPVKSVDIYVGLNVNGRCAVYAPRNHGVRGNRDPSGRGGKPLADARGIKHVKLSGHYMADRTGKLHIIVPASEGMGGIRRVMLRRNDYPFVTEKCETRTEIIPPEQIVHGPVGMGDPSGFGAGMPRPRAPVGWTKPRRITTTTCTAEKVTVADRFYLRAFARTQDRELTIGRPQGTETQRLAFTNPIWIRTSPVFLFKSLLR